MNHLKVKRSVYFYLLLMFIGSSTKTVCNKTVNIVSSVVAFTDFKQPNSSNSS